MAKPMFSGKLSNGVPIELIEAESFSGRTEYAVKVGGTIVSISEVQIKQRSGDILVKTSAKTERISADSGNPSEVLAHPDASRPNLSDIS